MVRNIVSSILTYVLMTCNRLIYPLDVTVQTRDWFLKWVSHTTENERGLTVQIFSIPSMGVQSLFPILTNDQLAKQHWTKSYLPCPLVPPSADLLHQTDLCP